MNNIPVTSLSSVLEKGDDSNKNPYLAGVKDAFKRFQCGKHGSFSERFITNFIRNDAIPIEQAHEGRTFLYLKSNEDGGLDLLGFFELSLTCICFDDLGSSAQKKIKSSHRSNRDGWIAAYCIAELGRSDQFKDELPGSKILHDAMKMITDCAESIGCNLVILDAEPAVFNGFYVENQFKKIQDTKLEAKYDKDGNTVRPETPIVLAAAKLAEFDISACGTRS